MGAQPALPWIAEATAHVGLAEVKGIKHHPTIVKWLKELGAAWNDDEQPWCGTFVAHCLQTAGLKRGTVDSRAKTWDKKARSPAGFYPKNWYGALDYSREGGTLLTKPAYGCVAVKTRKGGGHVAFVVGRDKASGKLVCLGGNQSDKVCYALYGQSEFSGFYWYGTQATPAAIRYDLPILTGVKATKVSEA